jgi:hypothetical protein
LNGNLILSKVGEGVFIVRGEKKPFGAEKSRLAGAKSAPPDPALDQPVHRPVTPGQHRAFDAEPDHTSPEPGTRYAPKLNTGRPASAPAPNRNPVLGAIPVGARWLYRVVRCKARSRWVHAGCSFLLQTSFLPTNFVEVFRLI